MIDAIIKGLTLGSILALSVGPVIFTIIKQSLDNGKEGGLSFVAGVWLSDIILVVLANAFSELMKELLQYERVIGYAGSFFLMGLGLFYLFLKKVQLNQAIDGVSNRFRKRDMARLFSSGFLLNSLNPSIIIFWLVNATAAVSHTLRERIVIFSICILLNIGADVAKVLLAGKLRKKLTVHNLSMLNKASGLLLLGFGIALLWSIVFHVGKI